LKGRISSIPKKSARREIYVSKGDYWVKEMPDNYLCSTHKNSFHPRSAFKARRFFR
jgi:hypothetical protein